MFKEKTSKNNVLRHADYRDKAVKGANIEEAARETAAMRKRTKVNPDTEHRMDIQRYIYKLVSEGNEFAVIWDKLSARFPNSKYKGYFPNWIMDKIEKSKRQDNKEREN